jgi:hypothetical protein
MLACCYNDSNEVQQNTLILNKENVLPKKEKIT